MPITPRFFPTSLILILAVTNLSMGCSDLDKQEPDNQAEQEQDANQDVPDAGDDPDADVVPDAENIEDYELVDIDHLNFVGAFRVPSQEFGASNMNYSQGPIALHPERNSVFLVGHAHHQSIAEFEIPDLVDSDILAELNTAPDPLQEFVGVLDRVDNPQSIDRIGGLAFLDDGAGGVDLLIHAYEYYDAPADNSHTTLMLRDPDDLANSQVDGYYELQGRAHTNGWVSPIPSAWQETFATTHLTGASGGIPIHGRASIGPTFFTFQPEGFLSDPDQPLPTQALVDYSLANQLHPDMNNSDLTNDIWTHNSRATFGFIIPESRTYLTIGYSGGHETGVCYKCTPEGADSDCGGYCARDLDDYSTFYWAYDLDDLLTVQAGDLQPHEVRPYAYGPFEIPFSTNKIGGGAFDPDTGRLFLTAQAADREGQYSNPPVIMVYELGQ